MYVIKITQNFLNKLNKGFRVKGRHGVAIGERVVMELLVAGGGVSIDGKDQLAVVVFEIGGWIVSLCKLREY